MSLRRSASHRSQRSARAMSEDDEIVDNPNAYGMFGRHPDAPQAVRVHDHMQDEQGRLGHTHQHRLYGVEDQHPGWQASAIYERPQHEHNFHLPLHQHQEHHPQQPPPEHSHPSQQRIQHPYGSSPQAQSPMYEHSNFSQPDPYGTMAAQRNSQEAGHGRLEENDGPHTPLFSNAARPALTPSETKGSGLHTPAADDAFHHVHGGNGDHIAQHGEQIPIRLGHLFKRPVIRQWILQDKVYREVDDREPSQFELFFDLVMVGVIHVLAEAAAEAATGLNVAKFILCFYPAWSVWNDVRSYINVSGTDDVFQRLYVLVSMILLMGYTANASGIVIEKAEGEAIGETVLLNGGHATLAGQAVSGSGESGMAAHRRAMFEVASAVGTILVKRGGGGGESEGEEAVLVRQIGHTGYWFASGWHSAIAGAIGFYLVAKFLRLLNFFVYGLCLPKFRKALWLNAISLVVISCTYLPIIFINRPGTIVILICIGMVLEVLSRYIVAAALQIVHGRAKHRGHKTYIPAYSLPHLMERTTLFTILVIGEVIMNSIFTAFSGEYGPQGMFWRSTLAIIIAFLLMWMYFDADSSRTFVHALKRHWFTSISYSNIHFPLSAGLVLMGSAMTKMIHQEAVEQPYLWFFSGSISLTMICMGYLGMLHKSLDRWGSSALPRFSRIGFRFVLGFVFAVMPLLHHWKSLEFLGAYAAMLAVAVAFETFGKIGSVGRVFDPVRAEELRRARKMYDSKFQAGEIPMAEMQPGEGMHGVEASEKASQGLSTLHSRQQSKATMSKRHTLLHSSRKILNKDGLVKSPGRRASWHEFDDLTEAERGEEDVGVESQLGKLESKELSTGERWAYVAT